VVVVARDELADSVRGTRYSKRLAVPFEILRKQPSC
jgi:hypothetical protein